MNMCAFYMIDCIDVDDDANDCINGDDDDDDDHYHDIHLYLRHHLSYCEKLCYLCNVM